MNNSWGILGKPSPEKIAEWQNLPYGKFKEMVTTMKKKSKGNTLKKHQVRVQKIQTIVQSYYHTVEAFTSDLAIEEVKNLDKSTFEWYEPIKENDKYTYQVVRVE